MQKSENSKISSESYWSTAMPFSCRASYLPFLPTPDTKQTGQNSMTNEGNYFNILEKAVKLFKKLMQN